MVHSLVGEFIKDNVNLKNTIVRIVHGKSTNILTKEVHLTLKNNKYIKDYHLNNWNIGETIVFLRTDK